MTKQLHSKRVARPAKMATYYPHSDSEYRLYFLTDLHLGNAACDEDLLRRDIARIASEPNALVIGGGDYIDGIGPSDKRFDPNVLAEWCKTDMNDVVMSQVDYVSDMLEPIADKFVGMLEGNHEFVAHKRTAIDGYKRIVRRINTMCDRDEDDPGIRWGVEHWLYWNFRYGTETGSASGWTLRCYFHHGAGGAGVGLPGGISLKLGRLLDNYGADLICMGHLHQKQMIQKMTYIPRTSFIESISRKALIVPSYLRREIPGSNADTYAQQKGMNPTPLGTFPVIVRPYQREFVAEV